MRLCLFATVAAAGVLYAHELPEVVTRSEVAQIDPLPGPAAPDVPSPTESIDQPNSGAIVIPPPPEITPTPAPPAPLPVPQPTPVPEPVPPASGDS